MSHKIDELKNKVPFDVQIKVGDTVYTGHVRGRLQPFATVYVPQLDADYTYSWSAVGRAYESEKVVLTV